MTKVSKRRAAIQETPKEVLQVDVSNLLDFLKEDETKILSDFYGGRLVGEDRRTSKRRPGYYQREPVDFPGRIVGRNRGKVSGNI